MSLPVLTPEQRQASLAKAAEGRKVRAEALGALKTGSVTLTEVLADDESPLQRAFVRQVLLALPGIGKVKAEAIMGAVGVDPGRRVRGLGARQREALAAALS